MKKTFTRWKAVLIFVAMFLCSEAGFAQTYTFTPAGATGINGPTQSQINTAYASTTLANNVTASGGIQTWSIPVSGLYKVEVYGANGYGPFGGRGAYMSGDFNFNASDVLKILVGQKGGCCVGSGTEQYGGGGGTFVVTSTNTPLIVAGGGGGVNGVTSFQASADADVNTSGKAGVGTANGTAGTNGSGGGEAGVAGGGGGFTGDGGGTPHGGKSFLNGGTGGTAAANGGWGGFGGGGGANSFNNRRGGGGGGYSGGGGAGSSTSVAQIGGGGGSYNTGSNQTNTPALGSGDGMVVITLLSPAVSVPNDVGLSSFVGLSGGLCPGNQTISVKVRNFGNNFVDSVMIALEVNGVLQSNNWYQINLDTFPVANYETTVVLGSINFPQGASTVRAWTSLPNNQIDTVNSNDTVSTSFSTSLSGVFTLNSAQPTSGNNFQNFSDFTTTLNANGLCGPLTLNVVAGSGPYNEQVTLNEISNASSTNTVTINGNGETLTFAGTSSAPWTLGLDGADYITVNNLNITTTSTTNGLVVHLWNQANHNTFSSCNISVPQNITSSLFVPFSISGSPTSATSAGTGGDSNLVTNCVISGGYYNTVFYGTSGTPSKGNRIENSTLEEFYVYGVYALYQDGLIVSNNTIERPTRSTVSTFYGIYFTTGNINALVEKNRIRKSFGGSPGYVGTGYGMYISSVGSAGNENRIFNNAIYDFQGNSTEAGIYIPSATYIKVYHNTINLDNINATAGTTYGIYSTGTAGVDIQNNNVSITRGGGGTKYAIYFSGTGKTSDYNNLYMGSTSGINYTGYYSTGYLTLANWKTANSGAWDQHSLDVNPLFVNAASGDLRPGTGLLDDMGTPLGITTDITGAPRSLTTPDIGAFEFSVAPCTGQPVAGVASADSFACPNSPIILSDTGFTVGSGITFQWEFSPSGFGMWDTIPGAYTPGFTYMAGITQPTDFRLVVTCINGGAADVSNTVTVNLSGYLDCYCSPLNGNPLHSTTANYITKVEIPGTTLNNPTSAVGPAGYFKGDPNIPSQTANLVQGQSYTLEVTNTSTSYTNELWIDWDQSGTFDTNEYVRLPNQTNISYSLNVPVNAVSGMTAMRLRNVASTTTVFGPSGACDNLSIGRETEDYFLTIIQAVACSGTPSTGGILTIDRDTLCYGSDAGLILSGYPLVLGLDIAWESAPAGSGMWTPISGATNDNYTAAALTSSTDFRAAVSCNSPGGGTAYSNIVTAVVINPQITSSNGGTRCGVGTVTLSATGTPGTLVNWYNTPTGGIPLDTGSVFVTPPIAATDTFYAGSVLGGGNLDSVAVPLSHGSTSGVYDHMFMVHAINGLNLNSMSIRCMNTVNTLTSWDIYFRPDNYQTIPGANTSSAGWTLISSTTNVPSLGTNDYTEIASGLGITIPAGATYSFFIAPGAGTQHQYATDATGTIVASNADAELIAGHRGSGLFNQTTAGGMATVKLDYTTGCEGTRIPVVATVTTPPAYTISASSTSICEGSSVTLQATSSNAYNFSWNPGGSGNSVTHTPLVTTRYYLTGSDANSCNVYDSIDITVRKVPSTIAIRAMSQRVCGNGNAQLSLSDTLMTGIDVQWQKNTGSGFTNIPGATAHTFSEAMTMTTIYKADFYCDNGYLMSTPADTILYANPQLSATFPGSSCTAGPVVLAAVPPAGSVVKWYDSLTGGTELGTGNIFISPAITSSTVYYAAAANAGSGTGSLPELMYFKFDVPGTSVANEASAAVSTVGTVQGTASIGGSGQVGTALVGSGVGSNANSMDANWPLNLSGPWTLSMWFSGVTNILTSNYLFGSSGTSSFRAMTGSGLISGAGNLMVRATGMTDVTLNNIFDATGTPVVVHLVYDPAIPAINGYVNGTLTTSVTQTAALTLTGSDFLIGGYATSDGLNAGGMIDEFRLYNRALNASEIASTWNISLGGCEGTRTAVTATINSSSTGTGIASGGSVTATNQGDGTTVSYDDQCSEKIATVADAPGGNVLGMTTAAVVTLPAVQTFGNTPFVPRIYDITPASDGPATVTIYALQTEFNAYNSYITTNSLTYPLLPTGPLDLTGIGNIVISQFHGSHDTVGTGPLGLYDINQVAMIPNSAITASSNGTYWTITFPVSGFSGFFIHTGSNPLAIKLTGFTAKAEGTRTRLQWNTASEEKGDRFEVQRSFDGKSFSSLGTVSANGKASAYTYFDQEPAQGRNFYRLKMTDASGRIGYSPVREVAFRSGIFSMDAYPNPVSRTLTVSVYGTSEEEGKVQITDLTGKVLNTVIITNGKATVDMSGFAQGVYFVKYADAHHSQTIKVTKD